MKINLPNDGAPFQGEALEVVVGKLLLLQGKRLAVAESCTGGRIAARLTRVPGSSRYFESACVTYSNRSKERLLSVPGALLNEKGAVSPEVALAMADGIRRREEVALGLAVTGIAGPEGGSPQKPVGLVYIALSDSDHSDAARFLFEGEREAIQSQAAEMALETVRRYLLAEIKRRK
jgi:PncC family amidohydrolase